MASNDWLDVIAQAATNIGLDPSKGKFGEQAANLGLVDLFKAEKNRLSGGAIGSVAPGSMISYDDSGKVSKGILDGFGETPQLFNVTNLTNTTPDKPETEPEFDWKSELDKLTNTISGLQSQIGNMSSPVNTGSGGSVTNPGYSFGEAPIMGEQDLIQNAMSRFSASKNSLYDSMLSSRFGSRGFSGQGGRGLFTPRTF